MHFNIALVVIYLIGVCPVRADGPAASGPSEIINRSAPTTSSTAAKLVEFQPGIRIDFKNRAVEVEATVILRRGLIELFACAPNIREHESIVRIEARPLHLYHALGLIGLTPGHPVRYDPTTEALEAATGDPVEIYVRYTRKGIIHTEPIERWMKAAKIDGQTASWPKIDRLPWVFAGSEKGQNGLFAADTEGTVVAVVNFDSALIALNQLHSDRNSELWLEPNTPRIPPEQTSCTLIFKPRPLRISLDATGRFWQVGQLVTLETIGEQIRNAISEGGNIKILVEADAQCPPSSKQSLLKLLKTLGVSEKAILIQPPSSSPSEHDAGATKRKAQRGKP